MSDHPELLEALDVAYTSGTVAAWLRVVELLEPMAERFPIDRPGMETATGKAGALIASMLEEAWVAYAAACEWLIESVGMFGDDAGTA